MAGAAATARWLWAPRHGGRGAAQLCLGCGAPVAPASGEMEAPPHAVPCPVGCGMLFCSEACAAAELDRGHAHVCAGQCEDYEHPLIRLKLVGFNVGCPDELAVALKAVALAIAQHQANAATFLGSLLQSAPCFEDLPFVTESATFVDETWALLAEAVNAVESLPGMDRQAWSKLMGFIVQRHVLPEPLPHPLLPLCRALSRATPAEQKAAWPALKQSAFGDEEEGEDDEEDEEDDDEPGDEHEKDAGGEEGEEDDDDEEDDDEIDDNAHGSGSDAGACRKPNDNDCCSEDSEDLMGQLTLSRFLNEPERYLDPIPLIAIPTEAPAFDHACIGAIRFTAKPLQGQCLNIDRTPTEFRTAPANTACLVDLTECDSAELRAQILESRGLPTCTCPLCRAELEDSLTFADRDTLLDLLDAANKSGDHTAGLQIADEMLSRDQFDSRALYNKARVLGWDDQWIAARRLRETALEVLASHKSSDPDFAKYVDLLQTSQLDEDSFLCPNAEFLDREQENAQRLKYEQFDIDAGWNKSLNVFVTKPDCPVLTAEECAQIIRDTEAHAEASGGWTTSRHYAVPTTDVKVRSVPAVLDRIRAVFQERIFPDLAWQFGCHPRDIRVIDAFVVRYSATGGDEARFFLPVHADQSQFSMTLALNGPEDFDGGGTWFANIDRAFTSNVGGMVSFHGALPHGGRAISNGSRYIIAAFLYADAPSSLTSA